jgi:hypothetical protein
MKESDNLETKIAGSVTKAQVDFNISNDKTVPEARGAGSAGQESAEEIAALKQPPGALFELNAQDNADTPESADKPRHVAGKKAKRRSRVLGLPHSATQCPEKFTVLCEDERDLEFLHDHNACRCFRLNAPKKAK